MSQEADAIALELVRHALDAVVDEMAISIVRCAYSNGLKNAMDMSCALCDAEGRLVAQGLTLPLHLGSIPDAMRHFLMKFAGRVADGDVLLLNDPFDGGSHLPDFYIVKPIFHAGALAGWAATVGHQLDVGGRTPGGNGCDNTEIFHEGLRLPPIKLFDRGVPNEAVFDIVARNVRVPTYVLGDVNAQLAACRAGERAYLKLIERHGATRLRVLLEALLAQSERYARNAIAAMPDGVYAFTDYLDDDGLDPDPVPITVTITVAGDRLVADFAGSARQTRGALNSALSFTKSAVYAAVRHLIEGDIPNNEGYFRPIEVRAPAGTVVNPVMPAAVAARGLTGFRIANVVFGALAKIAPDRVFACEVGGDSGVGFGGVDASGRPFVFQEFLFGSWGGRPNQDGIDACTSSVVNFSNNPIEAIESEYPISILRYEFLSDTGGAGRYRGGLALNRTYRFDANEGLLNLRADRQRFLPYGLQGGRPGTPCRNRFLSDGVERDLPSKGLFRVRRDDVLDHSLAGAGGWGDPFHRDPARVLEDVLDEKITPGFARKEYAVEVDVVARRIDEASTAMLRAASRRGSDGAERP